MKAAKLVMIFSVLIFGIIAAMFVIGAIDSDQAIEFCGKAVALVVITGGVGFIIAKVSTSKERVVHSETSQKQGPKF